MVGVLVMNTRRKLGPLKEAIESVQDMRKRVDCKAEEIRQEITRTTKKCLEVVKEREEELLTQVNNIHKMKTKTLDIQGEELEMMLGNLTSSIDFTENALKHGNEAEVMLVRKQMTTRLQDLNQVKLEFEPLEDEIIDYSLNPDEFRIAIERMGTVKMYHSYPRFCYATGVGVQRAKIGLEAVFMVTAKDRMNEIFSGGGEPVKVVIKPPEGSQYEGSLIDNQDGTYTVSYQPNERGTHTVYVTIRNRNIGGSPFSVNVTGRMDYGKLGKTMRTFGTEGTGGGEFNMPWAVAIDNHNSCFIITDCNNHRIQVFDFEGTFMFKFGTEGSDRGQFKNPKGVARFPNGQIVVADFNNHRVQVFNEDGRFLRKFGFYGAEEPGSMNHPCGVACTSGGMILVSEQDNHRVQMFDANGEPVRKFGCQGFNKGQFIYPHHVSVNQRGKIAVADCVNDRVQIFDLEGTYSFSFGKEGTQNGLFDGPEGVTFDDEDNILVCDYHNHRVQIFTTDGAFVSSFGQFGDEEGNFRNPCGITVTNDGNVIVVDSGNNRVQIF